MAVYGVKKEKIQGIYQSKGMACSVYVKKDDKEVVHFVTSLFTSQKAHQAGAYLRFQ